MLSSHINAPIPTKPCAFFCFFFMTKTFISEDNRLHTQPIIPFIPQPGYTHGTSPVPTALPPAHPVSCASCHSHERIIFCNRGVRIIHYLQMLLWQTVTSAPILHRQQGDYHHAGLSWHEMGSGHSAIRQSGNISECMLVLFNL